MRNGKRFSKCETHGIARTICVTFCTGAHGSAEKGAVLSALAAGLGRDTRLAEHPLKI
jgi:hypothetical protein